MSFAFSNYIRVKGASLLLVLLGAFLFVTLLDRGGLHYSSFLLLSLFVLPFTFLAFWADPNSRIGRFRRLFLVLGIFEFLFMISFLFSKTPNYGFPELVSFVAGPLIMFGLSRQRFKNEQIRVFLEWLICLAALTSLLGLIFFFVEPFNRVAGTFRNFSEVYTFFPNALANFLVMIVPFSVYFSLENKKKVAWGFLGVSLFLISILFLTFSRGAFLALFLEIAALFFYMLVLKRSFLVSFGALWSWLYRFGLLLLLSFAVAFFVLQIRLVFFGGDRIDENSFVDKASLSANEGLSSVSERFEFWLASLKMIKDHPLFGSGADSFRFIYPQYQRYLLVFSDHPHNLFLKMGVEHGVIVLTAFMIFLISAAVLILKNVRRLKGQRQYLVYIMSLSALGGLLHNLVDYNFNFVTNFLVWWVLLGLIFSSFERGLNLWQRFKGLFLHVRARWRFVVYGLSIFLAVLGLFEGYKTMEFRLGTRAFNQGHISEALSYFEAAESSFFQRNLYVDHALAYRKLFENTRNEIYLFKAQELLRKEVSLNEHNAFAWYLLAYIESDLSNPSSFSRELYLRRAIELEPFNRLVYYEDLIGLYLENGGKDALKYWFPFLDSLLNDYVWALARNAHLTILTDNPRSALRLCGMLLYLVRGDEFRTEYNDRCIRLENAFLDEVSKFEEAYGVRVSGSGVSFLK